MADGFALSGISAPPDPAYNAYRKDLADVALAGRVIASHYAEPLMRHLVADTVLRAAPAAEAEKLGDLAAGDEYRMLDCTRGWGWGYAPCGRVGYVEASAIAA